ncbi:MAG TPA: adenylate/guanylate cyclase domain-containing protein [Aggregatilineales bacterium]|nr:adenylate/guanylate cyclase domain-containing protein [Aggregatilineales bacterium]
MTTQIPIPGSAPAIDPMVEIQRLNRAALELAERLREHGKMLALRDLALPPNAVDSLQVLANVFDQMTTRLDNTQVELQQLRELARTTELINSTLDVDEVLNDVIDAVIALTGAERGYVILKDISSGELDFRVARDKKKETITDKDFVVSHTVVQQVATEGELVITIDASKDIHLMNVDSIANLQLRSILCVPLKRKGEITGVLYVDNRVKPNLFSEREQRLVRAFANQASIAIENARLFERVRASLREITELKDFLDNVFASIASGVITTDGQDRITTLNAAAASILDVSQEDAIGKHIMAVLPPLYEGFDLLLAEVREHRLNQTLEVAPVLESRGQISLDLKLSPLKDGLEIQGVAIVLDDTTELKARQAQISVVKRYLPPTMVDNIKTIDELELGGVEREISIMFCDVRGFTPFSERLEPEALMQTINKYLTVSSDAIQNYEGIIDKFMGDAVVGLFNTQLNPAEDHALRAVYAALETAAKVYELHEVLPPDQRLFFGIGVHTGPAVLGNVGSPRRKEFTAIGNSLQFAKLLQENALGGEVIVSEETFHLVQDYVVAEALKPRKLKDQVDFQVMYRLTGLKQ